MNNTNLKAFFLGLVCLSFVACNAASPSTTVQGTGGTTVSTGSGGNLPGTGGTLVVNGTGGTGGTIQGGNMNPPNWSVITTITFSADNGVALNTALEEAFIFTDTNTLSLKGDRCDESACYSGFTGTYIDGHLVYQFTSTDGSYVYDGKIQDDGRTIKGSYRSTKPYGTPVTQVPVNEGTFTAVPTAQ